MYSGSEAAYLQSLEPCFEEDDAQGSASDYNHAMQHQHQHQQNSQLLVEETSDPTGDDLYAAGASSEDMMTGSSSSEDFYTADSSCSPYDSTEESDEDGGPIMTRQERCFDAAPYRDSNKINAAGHHHPITVAPPSNQLPPLGRHYSAQPFFNSHISRHHQGHDDQQQQHDHDGFHDLPQQRRTPMSSVMPGRLATGTACAAAAVVVIAPLAQALSSHWPYFVAGGICASVSHTVAVPLDVLKTRIQTAKPGEYRGTWDALVSIWKSEGGRVLFGGAGATLVGYAMQGCLKVCIFVRVGNTFVLQMGY